MTRIRALGPGVIVLVVTLIGCENPALQQRFNRRQANLRRTVDALAQNEASRMDKLGATLDAFALQHERDVANTRRSAVRFQRWLEDDVERWNRLQPVYRQRIAEELAGDRDSIEQKLPEIVE